jgi:hypothetical protein
MRFAHPEAKPGCVSINEPALGSTRLRFDNRAIFAGLPSLTCVAFPWKSHPASRGSTPHPEAQPRIPRLNQPGYVSHPEAQPGCVSMNGLFSPGFRDSHMACVPRKVEGRPEDQPAKLNPVEPREAQPGCVETKGLGSTRLRRDERAIFLGRKQTSGPRNRLTRPSVLSVLKRPPEVDGVFPPPPLTSPVTRHLARHPSPHR